MEGRTRRCRKCKRLPFPGSKLAGGYCANCTKPTSTCNLGELCSYPRVHRWDHNEVKLEDLTLCEVHEKIAKKKLDASRKREKRILARQKARAT